MNTRLFSLSFAASLLSATPLLAQGAPRAVVQAGHIDPITSAAFSRDGKLVATVGEDKTVKVWHVATGSLLYTLAGHPQGIWAAAFSPDGKSIATGGPGKDEAPVRVRDAVSTKWVRNMANWVAQVRTLAYSPDSKLLAMAGQAAQVDVRNAESGEIVQTLTGFGGGVNCVAFGAHAKAYRLASGGEDGTIRIWNPNNGKELHAFRNAHPPPKGGKPDQPRGVTALAYSPDGTILASAGADGTARVWDANSGRPLPELDGWRGRATGVGFAGPELLVTTIRGGAVRFWNARTGKADEQGGKVDRPGFNIDKSVVSPDGKHLLLISGSEAHLCAVDAARRTILPGHQLGGLRDRGYSSAVAADGSALAVGMYGTVALWRPGNAKPLVTLRNLEGPVYGLAFSKNNKFLATLATSYPDQTGYVRIYDVATGDFISGKRCHAAQGMAVAFTPDGTALVTAGIDQNVGVWGVGPRGRLRDAPFTLQVPKAQDHYYSVAFSPDGKRLAAGSVGRVVVWDIPSGKIWHTFEAKNESRWLALAWAADGKSLAAGNDSGFARVWDAENKKPRFVINDRPGSDSFRDEDEILGVAYSPDGNYLLLAHGKMVTVWDAATGKPVPGAKGDVKRLLGHTHLVRSLGFATTKNGRTFLVTGSGDAAEYGNGDGQVKLWEFNRAKNPLPAHAACTLVSFWDANRKQENWAVIDFFGRYDASRAGDIPWLHFVLDNEPVALTQVKDKYYEPHLLDKILGLNPEAVRAVKDLTVSKPPPRAEVAAKDAKAKTVTLAPPAAGVGRVQVFVNGKEVEADAKPAKPGGPLIVDLSRAPLRGAGDRVRVVTWNADGSISSRGAEFDLGAAGPPPAAHKPELYAVVVGVSSYKNPKLDLRFAAKDAEDLAAALRVGGKRLFGVEQVHMTVLSSSGNKGTTPATKANIRAAFEAARKAHPDDMLVVFFAGHGVTVPDQDLYCYLTAEAEALDARTLAKPENGDQVVTSEELVGWIKQVPALKQVMVLDTCAAGAAQPKLTERRDVSSSQVRAVERLKDRTGFHVLMGCAADKVSYEANQFQQGLLTYALLQGMKGPALKNGNKVDVVQLFQHAREVVPKLAEDIGGVQRPEISSPHGNPFDLAELTKAERESIRLAQPRPQLIRPLLTNKANGLDGLGLGGLVRGLLNDPKAARGAPLAFVDCEELAHGFRPVGQYEVNAAGLVTVTLRVFRDNDEVAALPPVVGPAANPAKLADDVAKALRDWSATVKTDN